MTDILYMKNVNGNYIKEFEAIVLKNKDNYVCLDKTAFYPEGGGQPSDTGIIKWDDKQSKVKEVIKKADVIEHIIEGEIPPVGKKILGVIDWDKRFAHMKMHTAQHILSGIIFDEFGAKTVGNQIHAEYSRVDFSPAHFTDDDLIKIKNRFNEIVKQNIPIKIYEEEREELEKKVDKQRANLDLLPKFIKKLRIVEIEGFDICPCAGTHVKNTSEIPQIDKIKKEYKGKDTTRIIYSLSK
ncbi:MAG: alanyl-tRNA editing protein [Thermoplasmatota archaeon]|jgi:misacylated tRNA(Ala) deacylase